jgi:hypothetical protein
MAFKVKQEIRAELELDEIIYYYENIQVGLGNRFLIDYENLIDALETYPFFEQKYNIIRKLPFKKFPYTIHFQIDEYENVVYIESISCDYQNPSNTRIKL